MAIPIKLITFKVMLKPRVSCSIIMFNVPGPTERVFDNKKNCLTTPSGRINPNISPIKVPTTAPKVIVYTAKRIGLLVVIFALQVIIN